MCHKFTLFCNGNNEYQDHRSDTCKSKDQEYQVKNNIGCRFDPV